jgi:hypothetical protein
LQSSKEKLPTASTKTKGLKTNAKKKGVEFFGKEEDFNSVGEEDSSDDESNHVRWYVGVQHEQIYKGVVDELAKLIT